MSTLRRFTSIVLVLLSTVCTSTACTATSTSAHRDGSSFGGFGPGLGASPEVGSAVANVDRVRVEPVHVDHGDVHMAGAMRLSEQCRHCP